MVRRRGTARRSIVRRRTYRTRAKWDPKIIPRRFKLMLTPMAVELDLELFILDELERRVFEWLELLGIPTAQWEHYVAFAKRLWKCGLLFTGETYGKETKSLVEEFKLRGLQATVLNQIGYISADMVEFKLLGQMPCAWGYDNEWAPPVPADYVFMEGTASPYNIYCAVIGEAPFLIAQSELWYAVGGHWARKLVLLSDGTLYVVYVRQLAGQYQIYVKKSTDGGKTWTDETRISTYSGMNSYSQDDPSIAVDSDDHLHVVWSGKATGYAKGQIWYALYDGSWHTPVRISTYSGMNADSQYRPCIAVDSHDYLHVVWDGPATGYPYPYHQVWYRKYTTAWGGITRISTYSGMNSYPQYPACIAVDSNNYLHVVWAGRATGYTTQFQIWYRKYVTSWGTIKRISTYSGMATNAQYEPCIAVDSDDHLHVVWYGKATGYTTYYQIWYAKFVISWATPVRISTYSGMNGYSQTNPSIAVDSDDYLHVLWRGKAAGYTDYDKVWHAEYVTSWATPECLHPTGWNRAPNLRWSRWP